ncbi:hypothetical protein Lpp221_06829 [Lacticaseibacillus paracasei subsp. paracasei Lpp221]|nr:hypothetical protein Lpp221_06829 [Lacticaseibacillus paracasei subsp. paracasei Lpp221]MCT3324267.1 hypothetical protein [Lacticaseibacillus paracasei]MCT3379164.1 hypothetical protein [Lacticaseibacillus paracasei]
MMIISSQLKMKTTTNKAVAATKKATAMFCGGFFVLV